MAVAHSSVDAVLLTDDEAAAAAFMSDQPWLTPLPTIDITDPRALAAAVLRGRRSLMARELLIPTDDGLAMKSDFGRLVSGLLSGHVEIVAMPVDAALQQQGGSAITVLRLGDGNLLIDTVTAEGLHGFAEHDDASLKETIAGLAVGVVSGELPVGENAADDVFLAVARRQAQAGSTWLVLAPGKASVMALPGDNGEVSVMAQPRPTSVATALDLFWQSPNR